MFRSQMLSSTTKTCRRLLATTAPGRLYEFVVVVHDLPTSSRPSKEPVQVPALPKLTFMGNIMGVSRQDVCGDVFACQAASQKDVESQLQHHPFAKEGVWDMKNISIWPLETIHTSPSEPSQNVQA